MTGSLRQGGRLAARIATQSGNGVEQLSGDARQDATPSSFRSSCVRLGRTVSFISFSRNAASYFPRPRLRSQTTTSMMAPELRLGAYHRWSGPERSWAGSAGRREGARPLRRIGPSAQEAQMGEIG